MKYKLPIFALLMMSSAAASLHAQQQQDAPPVNVKAVEATLDAIKKKQHDDIKSTEVTLAQQLMAKASSPTDAVAYYMEAVYNTQFNGQTREGTEFQGWKKKHEGEMKDPNFRNALCLHLMYLSLAISHDDGVKPKDQIASLLTYIGQVRSNEDNLWSQEQFMGEPLSKSIFVRSLQIGQYVADVEKWEPVPININGIYEKVILPEYRRAKNSAGLFQYWDDRIEHEAEQAANSKRTFDTDKFNQSTKPALLWLRAHEYVELGQKNRAITEMLTIIKAYPYHSDATGWITQLQDLLKTTEVVATTPPPVPVAAATPKPPRRKQQLLRRVLLPIRHQLKIKKRREDKIIILQSRSVMRGSFNDRNCY